MAQIAGVGVGDPSEHVELDPLPSAVRRARAFVREHASGVTTDASDVVALCTSELVTNGVLHARTPIVLGVTVGRDRVLVTVADGSETRPESPAPDPQRVGGRGITLVDALADDWGVLTDDDGKVVWFTVGRERG